MGQGQSPVVCGNPYPYPTNPLDASTGIKPPLKITKLAPFQMAGFVCRTHAFWASVSWPTLFLYLHNLTFNHNTFLFFIFFIFWNLDSQGILAAKCRTHLFIQHFYIKKKSEFTQHHIPSTITLVAIISPPDFLGTMKKKVGGRIRCKGNCGIRISAPFFLSFFLAFFCHIFVGQSSLCSCPFWVQASSLIVGGNPLFFFHIILANLSNGKKGKKRIWSWVGY